MVSKFTIDRSLWLRGSMESELLNDDGEMCCLGFYGKACGIPDEELLNNTHPADLRDQFPEWLLDIRNPEPYFNNSNDALKLIKTNDMVDNEMSEAKREAEIKKIFSEHGVTVEFID